MADQVEIKPPKLHFVNERGLYVAEYIPPTNSKYTDWLRYKYVKARIYLGKDVYYWHLRHSLNPNYRKTSDLEFVQHVVLEHEQNPDDPIERRHFNRAWRLYGHEMKFFLQEIGKDKGTEWENAEIRNGHPYAYAYSKYWFAKYPEIEQKLIYHGVNMGQYGALMDLFAERAEKRRNAYCEENGLDPETGEKLNTAKKPGKARAKAKKRVKNPANAKVKES